MTAPVVIPTTTAPAQSISVNLNGQACRIELYTKSINVPSQSGPSFSALTLVGIGYGVSLNSLAMVVSGSVVGVIPAGAQITGAGIPPDTLIAAVPPEPLGTYTLSQQATPTAQTRVTAYVSTFRPSGQVLVAPPVYQNTNPVFVDLYVNDALVIGGVLLRDRNAIVRNSYFGFLGDIAIIDTQANEDPQGVPLTLPPPDLMNPTQRETPLALGGKTPASVAGTIPGLGSRWL